MFGRYGLRNLTTDDQPNIPLPSGGAGNGHIYARNRQLVLGSTWTPTTRRCSRCASAIRGPQAARIRRRSASASALDAVRPARPADRRPHRRRPADAGDHRLLRSRPPGDQSAVAVPDGLQPEGELHLDDGRAFVQERLRVPAHRHRGAGRQPALRPRHLQRPVHAAGRRRRRTTSTTSPTSCSACASQYALSSVLVADLRRNMHFAYLQDDWRVGSEPDAESRPALRVLDAVLGERTTSCRTSIRRPTAMVLAQGRLDLRPRADRSRTATTSARDSASPTRVTPRTVDPRRLRHQLRALQPRRRRRRPADQRPAGDQRRGQPDRTPRRRRSCRRSRAIRPAWPIRRSSIR